MALLQKPLSTAMNARTVGSGDETVVLAHGYGGDQSAWDNIVPRLSQNYKVVLFDWSFSGAIKHPDFFDPAKYSSFDAFALDLISLLEEMNLKSTVFIGHSMSGMIGCVASIKRPELFKRLVLVGSSPRFINSGDYQGGFEVSDIEQIFSNIETNFLPWTSSFAAFLTGVNDRLAIERYQNSLQKVSPEAALSVAKLVFLSDLRDMLDKVVTPCTIIQTATDPAVPGSVADFMHKKIKAKSTVEKIDTVGHLPHFTAHLQLLEVLERALGSDL
ncbi:hypothetical protein NMG60_11013371 [Bertholletia excelsa]